MVFSQTSHKTQTVLKVVKLDHLKSEKNHQLDGLTGAVNRTVGYSSAAQSPPVATTSYTGESLKSESPYSTMFHDSDFEFFQELDPLYYDPAKDGVVQTIDSLKKTEEKAHDIDTTHNTFSPQGWEQFVDVNSPLPQASFYNITPNGPLSPNDKFIQLDNNMFNLLEMDQVENNLHSQEKTLDISSLPMVFEDLTSENITEMNLWQSTAQVEWINPPDTHYNFINTNTHNSDPFINTNDSFDLKFESVMPRKVEIDLNGSECNIDTKQEYAATQATSPKASECLSVNVKARAPVWPGEISTPVILSQVISLEKDTTQNLEPPDPWQLQNLPTEVYSLKTSPKVDYEPITPKSECHIGSDNDDSKSSTGKRRRHDSEDSDETYTPYTETQPRRNKRRKPSVPIKDLIRELESQPKARRGRPPKRRESTVSSVCSVDDNYSTSTPDKYRELRDKNNEASKRSRMNRKLKEQQMELLAVELEEKNKKLRVQADILEEMTKKLKNELMAAMLKK